MPKNPNMQNFPIVTVICLCYNHEKYVVKTLESVRKQTYSNVQLIIVDDCSSDKSKSVIDNWIRDKPNILFIANIENLGNTKSFNNAAKYAKGNYIMDLAADDLLLDSSIEKLVETFEKTTFRKLGIVYGNVDLIDENDKHIGVYYNETEHPQSGDVYKMVISRSTKICSIGSLVKKEVFDKIGYYDEKLAYEDLDLWVRASRLYDFDYTPEIIAQKRVLSNSLSSFFEKKNNPVTRKLNQSSFKILEKILQLNITKIENRAVLHRMYFELKKFIAARDWKLSFKLCGLILKTYYKSL